MKIINNSHKKIMDELFAYYSIPGTPENANEKDIYKYLFSKVNIENINAIYDYMKNKSDFFDAPASTRFHGNYEGALATHSINVLALLTLKNNAYNLNLSDEEMIISSLCHDLCKCNFYKAGTRNKKIDGKWHAVLDYTVEDKFPLGHGNKSLFILMNYITVPSSVAMLITWHMGPFANSESTPYGFNTAVEYMPAICAMYTADMEAANMFELKIDDVIVD